MWRGLKVFGQFVFSAYFVGDLLTRRAHIRTYACTCAYKQKKESYEAREFHLIFNLSTLLNSNFVGILKFSQNMIYLLLNFSNTQPRLVRH